MLRKVILLQMLSLIYGCVAFAEESSGPIKIGVLTDLSGPASYYGNQTKYGSALAEKELREQGKDVQVILEDNALNTARGVSAAQKLLFIDKVDALYVDFTPIAVAVSALSKQNKKVMIYVAAAESVAKDNEYAFKTYSDYTWGCETLLREFLKTGVKKLGLLKPEAEYGELCALGAAKVGEMVEETYKPFETVATQILSFKKQGVEAVLNPGFEADSINMLKAAADLDYNARIGAGEDAVTKDAQTKFGRQLEGSIVFGLQRLPDSVVERVANLGFDPNSSAIEEVGLSYAHVKQLVAAVSACPNREGKCVAEALSRQGPDSDIGFVAWKNRMAVLKIVLKKFSGGAFQEIGTFIPKR